MAIRVEGIDDIRQKWNLDISQAQVAELALLGDIEGPSMLDKASLKKLLLDTDIKDIRAVMGAAVPIEGPVPSSEINSHKYPMLCQITKVVDVTQPKYRVTNTDNPSKAIYKCTVTTGHISFQVLLLDSNQKIQTFAPGTKLLLKEPNLTYTESMVILYPRNYDILGGMVPELYEPWKLQRDVNFQRFATGGRGIPNDAPKFEPLGTCMAKVEKQLGGLKLHPPPKDRKSFMSTEGKSNSSSTKHTVSTDAKRAIATQLKHNTKSGKGPKASSKGAKGVPSTELNRPTRPPKPGDLVTKSKVPTKPEDRPHRHSTTNRRGKAPISAPNTRTKQ
ncbi:tudor domain-containing protein 3, putative [Babesia ovis]|uniref:Tudor domain-containing protein 3, putative n=1 Tax=Babesia ovis TaxID=5869 RepID=A0A9W5TCR1_BABOV|nr:tudor domain-containing protein 3, putative [Babesia ovis]